jgi:hypothetical protein
MNTYHPHCNQHKCYHDGGVHLTPATAAVTTPTVQPYFLYAEYNPDGTKNVYLIKNNKVDWEKQVERQKEVRQYEQEYHENMKALPGLILLGMTFVAALVGYVYLAETYVLPFLHSIGWY